MPGSGHPAEVWDRIFLELRRARYDGVVSIEHEDASVSREEGIARAVALLTDRIFRDPRPGEIWWGR